MHVNFNSLRFDLPNGWMDISDDLPAGSPPTLARADGVGAIQFSLARYEKGAHPCFTIELMQEHVRAFFSARDVTPDEVVTYSGRLMSAGATAILNNALVAARYCSNGRDILLATYISGETDSPAVMAELEDFDQSV